MTTPQNYTVALPHFEGPLELLLNLIERHELEITELSISQVTGDYLATITALEKAHSDDLRWFLDIGSKLVAYKTRAIRKEQSDPEEDLRNLADLAGELERYQMWRSAAQKLQTHLGSPLAVRPTQPTPNKTAPKNLNLVALATAWRSIATQKPGKSTPVHRISISRADIQRTMQTLLVRVTTRQSLEKALHSDSRRTKTLSLLALLELVKQDLIELVFDQERTYVKAV